MKLVFYLLLALCPLSSYAQKLEVNALFGAAAPKKTNISGMGQINAMLVLKKHSVGVGLMTGQIKYKTMEDAPGSNGVQRVNVTSYYGKPYLAGMAVYKYSITDFLSLVLGGGYFKATGGENVNVVNRNPPYEARDGVYYVKGSGYILKVGGGVNVPLTGRVYVVGEIAYNVTKANASEVKFPSGAAGLGIKF